MRPSTRFLRLEASPPMSPGTPVAEGEPARGPRPARARSGLRDLAVAALLAAIAGGPAPGVEASVPGAVRIVGRSPAGHGSASGHGAAAAGFQEAVPLSRLEVALWPEYDRPEMLVIYRATLAADAELPAEVRFEIPAAAGEPNAVAGADAAGRLVNLDYERRVEGERAAIVFTASRPDLQIEYYDPGLQREGARRSYGFVWPGNHAVADLTVQIQRPVGANDLTVTPEATAQGVADDGLVYAEVPLGEVPAGATRRVDLEYLKPDSGLTAEALAAAAPETEAGTPPAAGADDDVPLGWIVGGIALILAAVLATLLLLGRTRTGEVHAGPVGTPRTASGEKGSGAPDHSAAYGAAGSGGARTASRFCTRCGAPAQEEDRFCHACGSALRSNSG